MDERSDIERLRGSGLKVTASRLAVLEAVGRSGSHSDVDRIAAAVRASLGSVSTKTIYENLRVLSDAGLLRRFEPRGTAARYERSGDNHHHLVCRSCGAFDDVACAVGAAPCLEPSSRNGFRIDEAEVIFWGTCPACLDAEQAQLFPEPSEPDKPRSRTP